MKSGHLTFLPVQTPCLDSREPVLKTILTNILVDIALYENSLGSYVLQMPNGKHISSSICSSLCNKSQHIFSSQIPTVNLFCLEKICIVFLSIHINLNGVTFSIECVRQQYINGNKHLYLLLLATSFFTRNYFSSVASSIAL